MDKKDFPVLLTADEISQILKCSKRVAYEIMDQKDFPLIKIRRSKRVNREDFFGWLDKQKKEAI
ncbi:helix-turn-helix domain-containing protein [Bacillus sp. FJAT-49736]|uniref:helix-turn-helix domain-containing protein n=1 Tax=Bacillus sp. FJAT-49736 TaxID=2833582 RepID=UPI001BC9E24B|nr:helix-turn-helix domain-containing protein [Bacillus sp. FJAT-49736]MBS4173515.1 helix-turn-helix domain-containing protein [Bacillus sp. FJAT-49736]